MLDNRLVHVIWRETPSVISHDFEFSSVLCQVVVSFSIDEVRSVDEVLPHLVESKDEGRFGGFSVEFSDGEITM